MPFKKDPEIDMGKTMSKAQNWQLKASEEDEKAHAAETSPFVPGSKMGAEASPSQSPDDSMYKDLKNFLKIKR